MENVRNRAVAERGVAPVQPETGRGGLGGAGRGGGCHACRQADVSERLITSADRGRWDDKYRR